MRVPFYYVIWCDSPLSQKEDNKIEYYIFKGRNKAELFFKYFKKLKSILGINNEYQQIEQYNKIAKYRCPLDDGIIIFDCNLRAEEKNLILNVITRLEKLDGTTISHKEIRRIINGKIEEKVYKKKEFFIKNTKEDLQLNS